MVESPEVVRLRARQAELRPAIRAEFGRLQEWANRLTLMQREFQRRFNEEQQRYFQQKATYDHRVEEWHANSERLAQLLQETAAQAAPSDYDRYRRPPMPQYVLGQVPQPSRKPASICPQCFRQFVATGDRPGGVCNYCVTRRQTWAAPPRTNYPGSPFYRRF